MEKFYVAIIWLLAWCGIFIANYGGEMIVTWWQYLVMTGPLFCILGYEIFTSFRGVKDANS